MPSACPSAVRRPDPGRFTPFNFTALKTAVPAPASAYGEPLLGVDRRGKYLVLRFEPVTFVVHLMQGGRLVPDVKQSPNHAAVRHASVEPVARRRR